MGEAERAAVSVKKEVVWIVGKEDTRVKRGRVRRMVVVGRSMAGFGELVGSEW